jgi:hypothetical protein
MFVLVPGGGVGAGRLPLQHRKHRPRPKHNNTISLKGQSHAIQNIASLKGEFFTVHRENIIILKDSFKSLLV